jgi:hypothetical protein
MRATVEKALTTPPSHWPDKAVSFAAKALAVALMLYVAARLIVVVLPVLIGIGIVALVSFAGWSVYQFRRSRW